MMITSLCDGIQKFRFANERVWQFNKPEDLKDLSPGQMRQGDVIIFNELAMEHFRSLAELKNFCERACGQSVRVRKFISNHLYTIKLKSI